MGGGGWKGGGIRKEWGIPLHMCRGENSTSQELGLGDRKLQGLFVQIVENSMVHG